MVLSSGGTFIKATNMLTGKALKAMNALFSITKHMQVPINIMFNLFDSFVQPILNYSCEIWGFATAEKKNRTGTSSRRIWAFPIVYRKTN